MKPLEQKIAIAEACNWTAQPNMGGMGGYIARTPSGECCYHNIGHDRSDAILRNCPDYPADLNACHEMEKVLTDDQFDEQYVVELGRLFYPANKGPWKWSECPTMVVRATAEQRAEAFLRTIGKWEDDK